MTAEEKLDAIRALCEYNSPETEDGQMICLYGNEEEEELCMSHCDCGWGDVWVTSIMEILDGES